jgi:hypothetical protein
MCVELFPFGVIFLPMNLSEKKNILEGLLQIKAAQRT